MEKPGFLPTFSDLTRRIILVLATGFIIQKALVAFPKLKEYLKGSFI